MDRAMRVVRDVEVTGISYGFQGPFLLWAGETVDLVAEVGLAKLIRTAGHLAWVESEYLEELE